MKKIINIGILIQDQTKLYLNGCNQQALFVYQLLNSLENITCILFTSSVHANFLNIKTLNISDNWKKACNLDIFICLSSDIIQINFLEDLKNNNIKLIDYNCGNIYYLFQEDIIFGCHNYIKNLDYYKYYDEIWVIPNYTKDIPFYNSMMKTPTKTISYVWNSDIIELFIKQKNYSIFYDKNISYSDTKYIIICEPNCQITKTSLIPLLICNDLYRSGFVNIKIICLCKPRTEPFKTFCENLEIYKNKLIEFYDRFIYLELIYQHKKKNLDMFLLSHNRDNPLNFLHLETLYLQYPLIHNTDQYHKAGYYYKTIPEGVQQLKYAFKNHKDNLKNYQKESNKILDSFSPYNKINKFIYKKYIDELIGNN